MESDTEEQFGFQSLPVDVKLRILSYFSLSFLTTTVARVCKDWWELSKDPSLWRDVEIFCDRMSSSEQYRTIVSRCSMLRKLTIRIDTGGGVEGRGFKAYNNISSVPEISSVTLKELRMKDAPTVKDFWMNLDVKFPYLETFIFEGCSYSEPYFDIFHKMSKLSCLKYLKAGTVYFSCQDDDNRHVIKIIKNFTRLEKLHLQYWNICQKCFTDMIHHLKATLKDLSLVVFHLTDKEGSLFRLCSKLTSLHLAYYDYSTDSFLPALEALNLETLNLQRIHSSADNNTHVVSSDALSMFFRSPHRQALQRLLLSNFSNLNDDVLECIGQSCTNLTELSIYNSDHVTDGGLTRCVKNLPKLARLCLSDCRSVSKNILSNVSPSVTVEIQ